MGRALLSPADVVRRYLAAFSTGDADAVAAHVTDDFVNEHTSALGESCAGRDEYRRRLPDFLSAFEGLRYEVEAVVADGSSVAAAYTMHAVHEGHPVKVRGVQWFDVAGDLIAHRVDYWDSLGFLRQVGQA